MQNLKYITDDSVENWFLRYGQGGSSVPVLYVACYWRLPGVWVLFSHHERADNNYFGIQYFV